MLMENDFLQSLRAFDKDHIPVPVVQKIKPYIANPEFEANKILTVCLQMSGVCFAVNPSIWWPHLALICELPAATTGSFNILVHVPPQPLALFPIQTAISTHCALKLFWTPASVVLRAVYILSYHLPKPPDLLCLLATD